MKTLIVYYSRSGTTRTIAEALAKRLRADIDEIKDAKPKGFVGVWLGATRQAMKEESSDITFAKDPKKYDLIVLGGPVWAWRLIPPLRRYLEENDDKLRRLAFFLTCGGNPGKNNEQVSAFKEPCATMVLIDKDVKAGTYGKELDTFVKELTKGVPAKKK